ncbi:Non-structural protein NSP1 like [uncultured Mediterranean phage uvMED]|nr:Non-structural protein NSP1 like [uncultured Mediterranean phage uvMED]
MSESSIPNGTEPLSMASAIETLLNTSAPTKASEVEQEPTAEAVEAEATEVEEVEVEAVEDQAETEADETEEYETEAEAEEVDYYTVKVDGEEMDVSADDLVKSFQLERTAQKRLSEAAEQRKSLEADRTVLEQEREKYAQGLAQLQAQLSQTGQEPTQEYWDKLYEEDPLEFVKQRENQRDREKAMQVLQQEQMQLIQQRVAEEKSKLVERIPEWRDDEVATREKAGLINFAQRVGFTSDELSQVVDSRLVDVLRRAYLYDLLQQEKPVARKKVAKAPKMVKGGKPKTSQDVASEKKRKAFDRLKKTGSKDAAVDFLLNR